MSRNKWVGDPNNFQPASEQGRPGRGAGGVDIVVVELHRRGGQQVDIWSHKRAGGVCEADVSVPLVVSQAEIGANGSNVSELYSWISF